MRKAILACLLATVASPSLLAQTLELPPRSPTARKGSEFAASIRDLAPKEREESIFAEVKAGNVPPFLRTLVPVVVKSGSIELTYYVAPDYLAVGSDDDYFLTPLTPGTAQRVADRVGCTLPTPRMVDDIYAKATLKLTPEPIPPSAAMTTVPVFLKHHEMILAQRKDEPPGPLVAGHKKDVVLANSVFATRGKVAIYGWHRAVGRPIQPLYTGHSSAWVDYSHGIRLVQRKMLVDGQPRQFEDVLADPRLAPLLNSDGVMNRTRYPVAEDEEKKPPKAAPGSAIDMLQIEPGVRVVIDRPASVADKPVLLVFYGLPNGNTVEQTIGKAIEGGDDWHFDIQHIGAQTRFLREAIPDRAVVVAYLENDLKSWPAWRKAHGDGGIGAILESVRARFDPSRTRVVLDGHSGGGSLIFGYINTVDAIPDWVERVAFLDANYAYETARHRDKLERWLKASDRHFLCVLAYNDAIALLNGKTFVSASGGTWGRSHLMRHDFETAFPFNASFTPDRQRFTALGGRVEFFLTENPDKKILHTVQVERNGFIESLLSGTKLEGVGYTYFGDRAYSRFIRAD